MTTAAEMKTRMRDLFVRANEQIVREIHVADKRGEPSAALIAAVREASIQQFKDIDATMTAPMDARSIARLASMTDEAIVAKYIEAMRPTILDVLAPVRPS